MTTKQDVIRTCTTVIQGFINCAEFLGDDPSAFERLQLDSALKLQGLVILFSGDHALTNLVLAYQSELESYDFINFWADRNFEYSVASGRRPAIATESTAVGQGGNHA